MPDINTCSEGLMLSHRVHLKWCTWLGFSVDECRAVDTHIDGGNPDRIHDVLRFFIGVSYFRFPGILNVCCTISTSST